MQFLRETIQSLRASPVFALAVLVTLGLAGLNALLVALMAFRLTFLLPGPFAQMGHFTEASHRVHDLTFGFLFLPVVVGMLAQLRSPARNVATQVMAVIPVFALALTLLLTFGLANNTDVLVPPWVTVGVAALMAMVVHPATRDFRRSFSVARVDRMMLALLLGAAVPLLFFAARNIQLQVLVPDDHAAAGHYGFMAAFAFTVIGVGLVASLRPAGWRLAAWVAGLLPVLLGIASVVYPEASSSLGLGWALAAIAWGVGFVIAAERASKVVPALGLTADVDPDRAPAPGTPRWAQVFGIVGLAAVLLFVARGLTGAGGGPGSHSPAAGDPGGQAPTASVTQGSDQGDDGGAHTPPTGVPDHSPPQP